MVAPLDGIRAIHNAFRKDMAQIDSAALEMARGKGEPAAVFERYRFFNEVLDWHAKGEETGVFPVLERIAPEVAWTYVRDHRGLDTAYEDLNRSYSTGDLLQTARASAVLHFHLKIHLAKEDTHLYRIFAERIPLPEQKKAMDVMAGSIPKERFPELVAWWFPLIGLEDRENMTRIWQMVLPTSSFARVLEVIKEVSGEDWDELRRRITDL